MAGTDGIALAAISGGALFLYAGIKNISVLKSVQNLIRGAAPAAGQNTGAAPGNVTGPETNISGGSAQALLQTAAAQYGWNTGAEWQALQNVEMAEAGYSPTVKNPSSGALGLAQALGHGNANTAGTLGNEYGGYGLTDAEAQAANSGDAGEQAVWMCNYIAATYGDPIAAWNHEQQYHWY